MLSPSLHIRLLLLSLCLLTLASAGCKRDKCKRVTCVNGTCVDGICNCDAGYYGDECADIMNDGLAGTWSLEEACTAGSDAYTLQVSPVTGSLTQLNVIGLWEQQDTIVATVTGEGHTFEVSRQRLGNVELSGGGTINDYRDELQMNYSVFAIGNGQAFDQCTATISLN